MSPGTSKLPGSSQTETFIHAVGSPTLKVRTTLFSLVTVAGPTSSTMKTTFMFFRLGRISLIAMHCVSLWNEKVKNHYFVLVFYVVKTCFYPINAILVKQINERTYNTVAFDSYTNYFNSWGIWQKRNKYGSRQLSSKFMSSVTITERMQTHMRCILEFLLF